MTMLNRYQIGNAQTIGRHEVQTNYFSTISNKTGELFAVLADGTIDHQNARLAATMAVEFCVYSFLYNLNLKDAGRFLFETALKANERIQDSFYLGKNPRLSLSMALFMGKELQYFNVGQNNICYYNGHNELALGNDLNNPYSGGQCNLAAHDIIGIFSSGVSGITHPMERLKIIGAKKEIFAKAQTLIELVNKKNLDNQANATALLIEVAK
ncbi:MAG: hypothetical protein LBB91_04400 [Clostridiales bacterium]|nr:hypothetical protein [Clostridiales bacterium]